MNPSTLGVIILIALVAFSEMRTYGRARRARRTAGKQIVESRRVS